MAPFSRPAHASNLLRAGRFSLSLEHPLIMGVVNVTPDSFSDGGQFLGRDRAIEHGRRLVDEGAEILDLGGESTRPGAAPVALDEELERVLPVLEALRSLPVPISVDTRKPEVMHAALKAGASMINDVDALQSPGALDAVRGADCALCLMHKQGEPQTMQVAPHYDDVVGEVREFLAARVAACESGGIARERLLIDPGFGFGKTSAHNLALFRALPGLAVIGVPLLVGLSRKSLFGKITGRGVSDRMVASVAAALLAVQRGAAVVRVHDVAATRDAFLVQRAINDPEYIPRK
jgi:dihydropteroate synthase